MTEQGPALYRHHRSSLVDSMATVREVSSKAELERMIRDECSNMIPEGSPLELIFQPAGHDDRVGWDTWYVIALVGTRRYVVGMSNRVLT